MFGDGEELQTALKVAIGVALLFAATTYALRIYLQLRQVHRGGLVHDDNPHVPPRADAADRSAGRGTGGHHRRWGRAR